MDELEGLMPGPASGPGVAQDGTRQPLPPAAPPGLDDALAAAVARFDRAYRRLLPVLLLAREPLRPELWKIALED